jgi:hypothetical protein
VKSVFCVMVVFLGSAVCFGQDAPPPGYPASVSLDLSGLPSDVASGPSVFQFYAQGYAGGPAYSFSSGNLSLSLVPDQLTYSFAYGTSLVGDYYDSAVGDQADIYGTVSVGWDGSSVAAFSTANLFACADVYSDSTGASRSLGDYGFSESASTVPETGALALVLPFAGLVIRGPRRFFR